MDRVGFVSKKGRYIFRRDVFTGIIKHVRIKNNFYNNNFLTEKRIKRMFYYVYIKVVLFNNIVLGIQLL